MAEALLAIDAEALYAQMEMMPFAGVPADRGREAFDLFRRMHGAAGSQDEIDEIIGQLNRGAAQEAADQYERAFEQYDHPLGYCALETARVDEVPVAITSPILPDRIVRLMAIGVGQRFEMSVRGFGYVTELQRRKNADLAPGFDAGRVNDFAVEARARKLVTLSPSVREISRPGSVSALADHRITEGVPWKAVEPNTSHCFYQQGRPGRWTRWTATEEHPYPSSRHDKAPKDIIRDALQEESTR